MAASAEGTSEGQAGIVEPSVNTLTMTDILKMTVSQLKSALQSLNIEHFSKRKRDLQMQLIERVILENRTTQNDDDDDDVDEVDVHSIHSVERASSATSKAQHSLPGSPSKMDKNYVATPATSEATIPFDVQIRFRELELEAEERKLRLKADCERDIRLAELQNQRERDARAHELALRQLEATNPRRGSSPPRPTQAFKVEAAVKLVPRFNENDIESFLVTFEKIAQLNAWPENKYAAVLQAHLSGKALKIFSELTTEQCQNYQTLKAALLTAYAVVPEVYRKRFRTIHKYASETYSEFAFRLALQFKRWTEGENAYSDIEKLRELLQLEQFKEGLDSDLANWLIDQKPKTLTEAARLSDQWIAVRKSAKFASSFVAKQFRSNQNKNDSPQPLQLPKNSSDRNSEKEAVGKNNNGTSNSQFQTKITKPKKVFEKIVCAYCKKPGHVISDCRKRLAKNSAETQVKDECLVNYEHRAARGRIDPGYRKHCIRATLVRPDGKTKCITLLRDTGALQSLVSKHTLLNDDYVHTGEFRLVRGISGKIVKVPLVELTIKSKPVSDAILCGLVDDLPSGIDGLLGNDLCPGESSVLAVTRAQTKALREVEQNQQLQAEITESQNSVIQDPGNEEIGIEQLFQENSEIDRDELIRLQKLEKEFEHLFEMANMPQTKNFKSSHYFMKNGVLMRSWRDKKAPSGAEMQQIVVPKLLRAKLLNMAHDIPLAGHLGTAKTLQRLQQNFYWPTIVKNTKEYCRTCDCCQRLGKGNKKMIAPLHSLPIVSEPFSQIAIDIIGPLSPCEGTGNRFILTILDLCTHYPEAIPLKEHKAVDVARALITTFSHFGFPKVLLSDLGSEFQSELMQIFLHEYKIMQIRTSPYHPMTDGACERFNGTLKSMLTAICDQYKHSWDTVLPWVLFAYREVPVETLGCSPFELLFGRSVTGPLALIKNAWINDYDLGLAKHNVIDFIMDTREKVRHAIDLATDHANQQRSRAKVYYDKRAIDRQFDIGDEVLVLLPMPAKPLHAKYYGPYKIIEKLGPVDYVVATPDRRKTRRVCHVNLLKKYHRRNLTDFPETENLPHILTATLEQTDELDSESETPDRRMDETAKLSADRNLQISQLCDEFASIFSDKPGRTHLCTHHIELIKDAKPFKSIPYRLNPEKTQYLKQEIANLLQAGLIEESSSPYASPVILVPKANKKWRLCTDLRRLNSQSVADPFPISRVDDLIDKVGKAKYLSKIDMTQGFLQVPLDDDSQPLTGFVTPFGQFQWKVMCFGLRNATATFSRLVSKLTRGLEEFAAAYVDDVLIFSDSWENHLKHLRAVFERIRSAGLTLNKDKCTFAVAEIDYLGHRIGLGKVQPLEQKVNAMLCFPRPTQRKQLQSFLGLAGYYRKYIPHFAEISAKLTDMLKKGAKFQWTPEAEQAFIDLKSRLASRPILKPPDFNSPFQLAIDASSIAIGAMLFQTSQEIEHPICYFSRKLDKHQLHYSTVEKEALALLLAVRTFSVYFGSTPVRVYTDHNPLVFLHRMAGHNQKLLRWSLELQHYNLEIVHRAGKDNLIPDILSRPSELSNDECLN